MMENLYIFIVVVLFLLAVSDLVVGVSNDAVNFLNSAIGAKAASFKLIMVVAALGIMAGAAFLGGMMEVARKGIFHPQYFYFAEIMVMFLAVMLTDVVLLDGFNTIGLPTSTTVSIVFELLGAAVGMSIIKVNRGVQTIIVDGIERTARIADYINSEKALGIISGILISVVVAFTVGALVQYLLRLLFSFNIDRSIKYFGGIFGGLAISVITYFIIFKGAKGATFMTENTVNYLKDNTATLLVYSFIGWTVLLTLLQWVFKFNILKFIVLVGTFALAMAFAGNDLVNFIGVPLAGLASFKAFIASGADPNVFSMSVLASKVKTDTWMLIVAGVIMVIVLWTSRKARAVVKTSVDLSRQDEGDERFNSSVLARGVVRLSVNISNSMKKLLPERINQAVSKRFDASYYNEKIAKLDSPPAFDMVRASSNLIVASVLIAFATSLKLPLSTTYVTFMVAMGTSLADRAWGRDSAVYRITGVFSVIGGWFLTALMAFTVSFVMTFIIYYGGFVAIAGLVLLALFLVYRTQIYFKKKEKVSEVKAREAKISTQLKSTDIVASCNNETYQVLDNIGTVYNLTLNSLIEEDRRLLKVQYATIKETAAKVKELRKNGYKKLKKLEETSIDSGMHYIQVIDYLRESTNAVLYITEPVVTHIENNHKPLTEVLKQKMSELNIKVTSYLDNCTDVVKKKEFAKIENLSADLAGLLDYLNLLGNEHLKRIKKEKGSTKVNLLYLNILQETKNLIVDIIKLVKAQRDFVK